MPGEDRLTAHLRAYLGAWPPTSAVDVIGTPLRLAPSWDGSEVLAVAVNSPVGAVVSVVPEAADRAAEATRGGIDGDEFRHRLAQAVGAPDGTSPWVVLRWSIAPAPLVDAGRWVDSDEPGLPEWLRAFPGPLLVAFDDHDGRYLAGVGIKDHTRWGRELAVGTDEAARGRGLARRLVAQAARAVLEDGGIPLYVHDAANEPSARVADAAGFPDRGWRLLVAWAPKDGSK